MHAAAATLSRGLPTGSALPAGSAGQAGNGVKKRRGRALTTQLVPAPLAATLAAAGIALLLALLPPSCGAVLAAACCVYGLLGSPTPAPPAAKMHRRTTCQLHGAAPQSAGLAADAARDSLARRHVVRNRQEGQQPTAAAVQAVAAVPARGVYRPFPHIADLVPDAFLIGQQPSGATPPPAVAGEVQALTRGSVVPPAPCACRRAGCAAGRTGSAYWRSSVEESDTQMPVRALGEGSEGTGITPTGTATFAPASVASPAAAAALEDPSCPLAMRPSPPPPTPPPRPARRAPIRYRPPSRPRRIPPPPPPPITPPAKGRSRPINDSAFAAPAAAAATAEHALLPPPPPRAASSFCSAEYDSTASTCHSGNGSVLGLQLAALDAFAGGSIRQPLPRRAGSGSVRSVSSSGSRSVSSSYSGRSSEDGTGPYVTDVCAGGAGADSPSAISAAASRRSTCAGASGSSASCPVSAAPGGSPSCLYQSPLEHALARWWLQGRVLSRLERRLIATAMQRCMQRGSGGVASFEASPALRPGGGAASGSGGGSGVSAGGSGEYDGGGALPPLPQASAAAAAASSPAGSMQGCGCGTGGGGGGGSSGGCDRSNSDGGSLRAAPAAAAAGAALRQTNSRRELGRGSDAAAAAAGARPLLGLSDLGAAAAAAAAATRAVLAHQSACQGVGGVPPGMAAAEWACGLAPSAGDAGWLGHQPPQTGGGGARR